MNIDKLEAGPKLDALVAEHVMEWTLHLSDDVSGYPGLWKGPDGFLTGWCSEEWPEEMYDEYNQLSAGSAPALFTPKGVFRPSIDWGAAGEVMEKLFEDCIVRVSNGDGDSRDCDILPFSPDGKYQPAHVSAETCELAICLAALESITVKVE